MEIISYSFETVTRFWENGSRSVEGVVYTERVLFLVFTWGLSRVQTQ